MSKAKKSKHWSHVTKLEGPQTYLVEAGRRSRHRRPVTSTGGKGCSRWAPCVLHLLQRPRPHRCPALPRSRVRIEPRRPPPAPNHASPQGRGAHCRRLPRAVPVQVYLKLQRPPACQTKRPTPPKKLIRRSRGDDRMASEKSCFARRLVSLSPVLVLQIHRVPQPTASKTNPLLKMLLLKTNQGRRRS